MRTIATFTASYINFLPEVGILIPVKSVSAILTPPAFLFPIGNIHETKK